MCHSRPLDGSFIVVYYGFYSPTHTMVLQGNFEMSDTPQNSARTLDSSPSHLGKIIVYASKNGNPAEKAFNITVDPGIPRYYLHVYDGNSQTPCSTAFDVRNSSGQAVPW